MVLAAGRVGQSPADDAWVVAIAANQISQRWEGLWELRDVLAVAAKIPRLTPDQQTQPVAGFHQRRGRIMMRGPHEIAAGLLHRFNGFVVGPIRQGAPQSTEVIVDVPA